VDFEEMVEKSRYENNNCGIFSSVKVDK